MAHHKLLDSGGNRYDAHRPYAKQRKPNTCAQAPLCDGDNNASGSSDQSASAT